MKKTFTHPTTYVILITVVILCLNISLIISNLNRGFDWTDESFVVSLIEQNKVSVGEAWGFQHLLQPLWILSGETILGARVIRLIATQIAVIVATIAVFKFGKSIGIQSKFYSIPIIFICSETLSILSWVYWPRVMGYNELAAFLSTTGSALIVILASEGLKGNYLSKYKSWLFPIALGLITALLILTKITTGLLFGMFAVAGIVFFYELNKFAQLLRFVGTFVLSIPLFGILGYPLGNYVSSVYRMITDQGYAASFAHPPQLLKMSLADLNSTAVTLAPFLISLVVSLFIIWNSQGSISVFSTPRINFGVLIYFLTFCLMITWISNQPYLENKAAALGLCSGTLALALLLPNGQFKLNNSNSNIKNLYKLLFVGVLVFFTPLMSAFGTNGTLTVHAYFNETLWGAFLGLGIIALLEKLQPSFVSQLLVAFVIPVIAFLGFKFQISDSQHPYRNLAYSEQNTKVSETRNLLKGLYLDKKSAEQLKWLSNLGSNFSEIPVVAIASPGALLAFNGNSFASPFIEDFWPGSFGTISAKCDQEQTPENLILIIPSNIIPGSSNYELLASSLSEKCNLSIQNDFRLVATSPINGYGVSYSIWSLLKLNS